MSVHAWSDYVRAADAAGVTVRTLARTECAGAVELLGELWGSPPMTTPLLIAMQHAGSYVAGAFQDDALIGVVAGFFGAPESRSMHSQIAGVRQGRGAKGIGTALKLHQRAWCLDHGATDMTWTFDPLVARNAAFNVRRLGATLDDYIVDFYGPLDDGINAGQGSDRLVVRWHLDRLIPAEPSEPADAPLVLAVGASGQPTLADAPHDAAAVAIEVPQDIEALRREDPALAAQWRLALRDAMHTRWLDGWRPTSVGRDGRYLLERPAALPRGAA